MGNCEDTTVSLIITDINVLNNINAKLSNENSVQCHIKKLLISE